MALRQQEPVGGALDAAVRAALVAPPSSPIDPVVPLALRELAARPDQVAASLARLTAARPTDAQAWWLAGLAEQAAQRHEQALISLERAHALAPRDARIALTRAQLRYETGRAAARDFAAAAKLLPDDPAIVAGEAAARQAEGELAAAERLLERALARRPGWLDGQARLATLRQTAGQPDYDRGYAEACAAAPGEQGLWLAWFQLLAKARRWADARDVLERATATLGERPALAAARLYLLSESGERAEDPELFCAWEGSPDPGLAIARIRHALRGKRPDAAARIGERFVGSPAAALFWPYLSLAWRLTGDARAMWLDRPDALVGTHQLDLSRDELTQLAALLRSLHTMAAPYLDQSVRGGTQTDRPLLFRHEPIVRRARAAIMAAVAAYVAALPPPEPGHPLLGIPRAPLRLAGSWSVRLKAQGYHASHTHPAGWLSSAFYVSLPEPMGEPPAGWLLLGTPPPELGLDLAPYRRIEPKVGRLALFPATTWHGTAPFADGERLTIAFDVAPPRG